MLRALRAFSAGKPPGRPKVFPLTAFALES
jgi:hypothetical protein